MKVILLQDVKALGKKGQTVDVSDGYARNCILPKKLGVEATCLLNIIKRSHTKYASTAIETTIPALTLIKYTIIFITANTIPAIIGYLRYKFNRLRNLFSFPAMSYLLKL